MLRLTPLRETASVQEVLKEDRVDMLTAQIQDKFKLSDKLVTTVRTDLEKLNADTLYLLIRQILHLDTLEALEQWLADHQPIQQR